MASSGLWVWATIRREGQYSCIFHCRFCRLFNSSSTNMALSMCMRYQFNRKGYSCARRPLLIVVKIGDFHAVRRSRVAIKNIDPVLGDLHAYTLVKGFILQVIGPGLRAPDAIVFYQVMYPGIFQFDR